MAFQLKVNPGAATLFRNAIVALPRDRELSVTVSPTEVMVASFGHGGDLYARLRIPISSFAHFSCGAPSGTQLDADEFIRLLTLSGDEYDLGLTKIAGQPILHFSAQTIGEDGCQHVYLSDMIILEEYPLHTFELNNFVYQAVIGIPAEEFIRLITHLHHFGNSVSIHATEAEVKISAENETVVYKTERLECVVGGIQDDQSVSFNFSLGFLNDIVNACELSTVVWFAFAEKLHPALICPIGTLGNMMLVPEWARVI